MVLSQLHTSVQYREDKDLCDEDVDMDTTLYSMFFPNMRLKLTVGTGKPRYTMKKDGIVFFPIYLVHEDQFVMQIGVYEIFANELPTLVDEDNNIDISLMRRDPVMYSFANQESLKEYGEYMDDVGEEGVGGVMGAEVESVSGDEEDEGSGDDGDGGEDDGDEGSGDEGDEGEDDGDVSESVPPASGNPVSYMRTLGRAKYMATFVDQLDHKSIAPLPTETSEDAAAEKSVYVEKLSTTWIEKFMKNNNYSISKTAPDGNCFFHVIRDAFESIGKRTSIDKLRTMLAESITEETYMNYKEKYTMFKESVDQDSTEIKQLKDEIIAGKKKYKLTKDRKAQVTLETYIEEKTDALKKADAGVTTTKDIMTEFEYMGKIDSIEQFRDFVKTDRFWGDTVAISTLERLLNIKIIILSQEAYDSDDKDNVVTCGQLNDTGLEDVGKFEPSYYVIAQFSGDHYDLIGYKSKFMLQFDEIPHDMKKLIVMKCLEKNVGPYNLIPDFKSMKSVHASKIVIEDVKLHGDDSIYNEAVVLQVYHNSSDKPFPGKGAGESLFPDDPDTRKTFAALSNIINWRRKLAHTHVSPFLLRGKNWNSVEHYIQAQKFRSDPGVHDQFTLESKSSISEDPLKARDAGTKKAYFKEKYRVDPGFGGKLSAYLTEAIEAKFSNNDELKALLLATRGAKIVSFARANTAPVMTELMEVRKSMM